MRFLKAILLVIFALLTFVPAKVTNNIDINTQKQASLHLEKIISQNKQVSFTITLIDDVDKKLKNIPNLGSYLLNNKREMFLHNGKLVIVGRNWMAREN